MLETSAVCSKTFHQKTETIMTIERFLPVFNYQNGNFQEFDVVFCLKLE